MEYVLVGIVVLLLVAGFITFFVINAAGRSGRAGPSDPGDEGNPAGIASPDSSPLGDTSEHAGDQEEGHTVDQPEDADSAEDRSNKPRVGDPGPEAQSPDTEPPESERLADRPR